MKNLLLALVMLAGISFQTQAQYVSIPDTSFGKWLNATYSGCMQGNSTIGWQMDTTCSAITTAQSISLYYSVRGIDDLTGIQYFDQLKGLSFGYGGGPYRIIPALPRSLTQLGVYSISATSLPVLPSGLQYFYCNHNNQLTSLPALPASLIELHYFGTAPLTSFPIMPNGLKKLYFKKTNFTTLPPLPNSLEWLHCQENQLTSLPAQLPTSLTELRCEMNQLTSLPTLPNSLQSLFCYDNQLTSLPALPNSLSWLYCYNNQLTSMPAFPTSLSRLDCSYNLLTSIPPLNNVVSAYCGNNLLTSLVITGSGFNWVHCNNNQLTAMPQISGSIYFLDVSNNPIACLPAQVAVDSALYFQNTLVTCVPNYNVAPATLPDLNSFPLCSTSCAPPQNYVIIPDTNFGTWLNTHGYSACLMGNNSTGWLMDTTCTAVVNATQVAIYSTVPIHNLTGIQYFDNLQKLWCYSLQLTYIPALPRGLTRLDCENNQLTSLPPLPATLTELSCWYNQLSSLPALPPMLTYLQCSHNLLTSLPALPTTLDELACQENQLTALPTLPSTLTKLNCGENQITALPALPTGLQDLWCNDNLLTALPTLPASLFQLICDTNQITALPALPSGLNYLNCDGNQLTALPALPSGLAGLSCSDNLLTSLPTLSTGMWYLICSYNQLTSLPALNNVGRLICDHNQITSIPPLPTSHMSIFNVSDNPLSCLPQLPTIDTLYFNGTSVTCLFNYGTVQVSSPNLQSVGLCQAGNPNGCPVNSVCGNFSLTITSATNGALPDTLCGAVTGGTPPFIFNWTGNVTGLPNQCFELISGPFSITVTDSAGCVATYTTDSICANQCVWPGDADYNGIADNNDLLPIGLAYGKTGTARTQQDINWYAHPAQDWVDTIRVTGTGSSSTNIINISSSTGISLGMSVAGTGIAPGAVVTSVAGTMLALSKANTGPVSGFITFSTPAMSTGINSKHADCDGNGVVNAADTLAIIQNFGSMHAKQNERKPWRTAVPALFVELQPDTINNGDTLRASLLLGDVNLPVNDAYGFAFTLNYDPTVVDTTQTTVTFGDSWLGNATDKISIAKDLPGSGQLRCAVTRIDHATRTGYGKIGQVNFVITTDNINGKDLAYHRMNVWISDLTVIDNVANLVEVNEGADSTEVEFTTGIGHVQLRDATMNLIPNPASGNVQLVTSDNLLGGEMKVLDVMGKILFSTPVASRTTNFSTHSLAPGVYLVQVVTDKGMLVKRLVVYR